MPSERGASERLMLLLGLKELALVSTANHTGSQKEPLYLHNGGKTKSTTLLTSEDMRSIIDIVERFCSEFL